MKKFSLNGIEMGSKMTLKLVCFLAAAMHLTFLLIFRQFKVTPLMIFNIGSVTFYLLSGIMLLRKDELKHYLIWITAIFTEIVVHATLCTLLLGVDTCFVLYPITVLPICAYFFVFAQKRSKDISAIGRYFRVCYILRNCRDRCCIGVFRRLCSD